MQLPRRLGLPPPAKKYDEEQMTVSNDCLRALKDILTEVRRPAPTARPATPLPPRPRAAAASGSHPVAPTASVPLLVITAPARDHPIVVAPAPPASGPAPSTRTRLLRKSAVGPKNYVDKPPTPSPQSSPDPLNPPTVAEPSRRAPSYASAAATGGAFQPVVSRRNRNHRNRTPKPASPTSPPDIKS